MAYIVTAVLYSEGRFRNAIFLLPVRSSVRDCSLVFWSTKEKKLELLPLSQPSLCSLRAYRRFLRAPGCLRDYTGLRATSSL